MGNGCQAFFEEETEKNAPLGAVSHWVMGHSCNHRETRVCVPVFPLKWEIVPVFPLKWVAVTETPFPRPLKIFFTLYTQWVIYF